MSYRVTILFVVGAIVSLTLGVAAFEFFQASPAAAVADEPRDYSLIVIQFALLYCAVICAGGAMDCFFAGKSEKGKWPEDLSDDKMGDCPDSRAAHKS